MHHKKVVTSQKRRYDLIEIESLTGKVGKTWVKAKAKRIQLLI